MKRKIILKDKGNGLLEEQKNLADGKRFYISVYREGKKSKLIINGKIIKAAAVKGNDGKWKVTALGKKTEYGTRINAETEMVSVIIDKMVERIKLSEKEIKESKWVEEKKGKYKKVAGKNEIMAETVKDRDGREIALKVKINGEEKETLYIKEGLKLIEKDFLWDEVFNETGYFENEKEWEGWAEKQINK